MKCFVLKDEIYRELRDRLIKTYKIDANQFFPLSIEWTGRRILARWEIIQYCVGIYSREEIDLRRIFYLSTSKVKLKDIVFALLDYHKLRISRIAATGATVFVEKIPVKKKTKKTK